MVAVDIVALTVASLKAVGQIAVMAGAGFLMTRIGIITNEVRKGLGELSMNLLLPCLMFSQVIYCNTDQDNGIECPNMAQTITHSAILFFWPLVVVGSGYLLGSLAAIIMRVPPNFRRAAAGSVAFGNSTGMPVVLLTALGPSLVKQGVLQGSPLLFLPVYLVLSPLLQWTVGSYVFRGPKVESKGESGSPTSSDSESIESSNSQDLLSQNVRHSTVPPGWHREVSPMYDENEMVVQRRRTMGMPPPIAVGNGLSAQAEVEDVLVPEDIQLPRKRDKWANVLKKIFFMFVSPPVAATILGIFVAFIRPLQNQFINLNDPGLVKYHVLDWFYISIRKMGESAVPINLIMLGSNLSKGADFSALPISTAVILTLTKMWIQPAMIALCVYVFARIPTGPTFTGQWLVAIVVSLTPTANNIMVQVEVGGQDKAAMSTLIFIQYLLSPVLLTVSLTAASALMQVDGFLPPSGDFNLSKEFHF
eukprot:Skav206501  [mRNA]  locus=scaffold1128:237491:238921:+ [translate_table: standard]